jgi:hypothetical protein
VYPCRGPIAILCDTELLSMKSVLRAYIRLKGYLKTLYI